MHPFYVNILISFNESITYSCGHQYSPNLEQFYHLQNPPPHASFQTITLYPQLQAATKLHSVTRD